MQSSIGKHKISEELDFCKNMINNMVEGKSEVIDHKLTEKDVSEIRRMSEDVASITGLNQLRITPKLNEMKSIKDKCLYILENKNVPSETSDKVNTIIERFDRYEKYLLLFLKKYS
jgi:hypothetical protein